MTNIEQVVRDLQAAYDAAHRAVMASRNPNEKSISDDTYRLIQLRNDHIEPELKRWKELAADSM